MYINSRDLQVGDATAAYPAHRPAQATGTTRVAIYIAPHIMQLPPRLPYFACNFQYRKFIPRAIRLDPHQAYPGRIPFLEFFERFELLQRQLSRASVGGRQGGVAAVVPSAAHATEEEANEGCRSILEAFLPNKFYQIGHTRVS